MSDFYQASYDPETDTVRKAHWMDDYFGRHRYGVRFEDRPDTVYHPDEVNIPTDAVFVRVPDGEDMDIEIELALNAADETALDEDA